MARPSTLFDDSDSEFGYDFTPEDEQLLLQLVSNPASELTQQPVRATVIGAIDTVPGRTRVHVEGDESGQDEHDAIALAPGNSSGFESIPPEVDSRGVLSPLPRDEGISYPDLSEKLPKTPADDAKADKAVAAAEPAPEDDERSPMQRFRTFPRKPLTVTDLTSGAWCELQYWYTLTRLPGGRRTRTAAMKQGTKVHQKLEDEVHTTVKFEITTREDGFGLRLWNLVQGLRTLRSTGLTRELEVWGTVDGNLVNGVIDELRHTNPNPQFEKELSMQGSQQDKQSQSMLTDYFPPTNSSSQGQKVYLADVKTRGTLTPVSKALLRPAKIQLLLYHRFLADMAAGKLDFFKVMRRYGLDAEAAFSDTFIAQIASLHDEIFVDAAQSQEDQASLERRASEVDEVSELQQDLLKYQTLRELVGLVKEELALTFPAGEESIGHMLNVKYVYRGDGREIDTHDFPYSNDAMEDYLSRYMPWWRGEHKADGVQIEEAFKCRTCEFAADCTWRQEMDDQRVKNARRKMSSRKSIV